MNKIFLLFSLGAVTLLAGCAASHSSSQLPPQAVVRQDRPVKMINGEPCVYVAGESGSNVPGRWVPQHSAAAQTGRSSDAVSRETVQQWQTGGYH